MTYPQFTDFNEALQNPVLSPMLTCRMRGHKPRGLPIVGRRFHLHISNDHIAPQSCGALFHRQVPSAEQRYDAISKKLGALPALTVNFDYQPKGIKIRGSGIQSFE